MRAGAGEEWPQTGTVLIRSAEGESKEKNPFLPLPLPPDFLQASLSIGLIQLEASQPWSPDDVESTGQPPGVQKEAEQSLE